MTYLNRILLRFLDIEGVQEKMCFFTIHCNPYLASLLETSQSSQHNASVQLLLLAGSFCITNNSRVLAREVANFREFLGKIFNEHPVLFPPEGLTSVLDL